MRFYLNDLEDGTGYKSCLTESIRGAANLLRLYLQSSGSTTEENSAEPGRMAATATHDGAMKPIRESWRPPREPSRPFV